MGNPDTSNGDPKLDRSKFGEATGKMGFGKFYSGPFSFNFFVRNQNVKFLNGRNEGSNGSSKLLFC